MPHQAGQGHCLRPADRRRKSLRHPDAKELNQDIFILSRSEEEESEHRLLRPGLTGHVPYTLGGMRMAMAILRPAMLDFMRSPPEDRAWN